MVDNRAVAVAQRQALAAIDSSPRQVAQRQQAAAAAPPRNTTGLPDNLKAGVENLSGYSLDDVQVHYNSVKPAQLQAHAYAQGTDIHVAPGQEQHLPHEAWHVVQQKQGRVKAIVQMKQGLFINNENKLEQEADYMGNKIMNLSSKSEMITKHNSPCKFISNSMVVTQLKFIMRNGEETWIGKDEKLNDGDTEFTPEFAQHKPRILISSSINNKKGIKWQLQESIISADGTIGAANDVKDDRIPANEELEMKRISQGEILRKMYEDECDINKLNSYLKELEDLALALEKEAGDSIPSTHKNDIEILAARGEITEETREDETVKKIFNNFMTTNEFRKVGPSQDETTRSSGTAAFMQGFGAVNGEDKKGQLMKKMKAAILRNMSASRLPTSAVVAPIRGEVLVETKHSTVETKHPTVGQQHPSSDEKKIIGGRSSHSYSDRQRANLQNKAFEEVSKMKGATPNAVFLSSLLATQVATTSTMSAPLTAANIDSSLFNVKKKKNEKDVGDEIEAQFQNREKFKRQGRLIVRGLGLRDAAGTQNHDENFKPDLDRSFSLVRVRQLTAGADAAPGAAVMADLDDALLNPTDAAPDAAVMADLDDDAPAAAVVALINHKRKGSSTIDEEQEARRKINKTTVN